MAHSNYKVLTDVDLSKNSIFNVAEIRNDDSKNNLTIHTEGNTTVNADNLTSTVNTKTSLETGTSEVTVNDTATEIITNSKVTTVAVTTTETINSTGVKIETPSQTVVASGKSETISPLVTLVTGPLNDTDESEQARIALTKVADNNKGPKADIAAKTIAVTATESITQTAPTSTYKTTDGNREISLDNADVTLTNNSETVKLKSNQTKISGTELYVDTNTVNVRHIGTNTISANDIHLHTKEATPVSGLDISSEETTLKSPKITLNGTENEGVKVKSGDNSSSIDVTNATVNIASKNSARISANTGTTVSDKTSIEITAPNISEAATNGSIGNTAGAITLTASRSSGDNTGNSTLKLDGNKATLNTSSSTVAATSITQTASTSTYQTDETGSNRLKLTSGNVEIKSGTEVITLTKDTSTRIGSSSLTVDADDVTVTGNETTSIEASNSVSVDIGPKSNPFTTIDATTTEIALASKKASLTASVTESGAKRSSSIILSPAEETSLVITTDKNLKISSVSGDVGVTGTTLNSNATILANKDLTVAGTATFNGRAAFSKGASVNALNLNGVTIEWNSSLGALTFSRG